MMKYERRPSYKSRSLRENEWKTQREDIHISFVEKLEDLYFVDGDDFDVEVDLNDGIVLIYVFGKSEVTEVLLEKYYKDDFGGFIKGWTNSADVILSQILYQEKNTQENTLVFRTTV